MKVYKKMLRKRIILMILSVVLLTTSLPINVLAVNNSNGQIPDEIVDEKIINHEETQNLLSGGEESKPENLGDNTGKISDELKFPEKNTKDLKIEETDTYVDPFDNPDNIGEGETANPYPIIIDNRNSDNLINNMLRSKRSVENPIIGIDHPTEEGQVMLFKEVKPVDGKLNTFDVTLRIEAKDSEQTNDIVLVIDVSGSMDGARLANAQIASKQFVNQLLTEQYPNTRISLVSFDSNSSILTGFLNYENKETILNRIENLSAYGATFTQAGVKTARNQLGKSTADIKQIVLLSDGEPTFSYKMYDPDSYLVTYDGPGRETSTASPESNYNYDETVGNGRELRERYYGWFSNRRYYNNGNSAIAEAGFAKNTDNYTLHTIALDAGDIGTEILESMASPDSSYSTTNPTELSAIFGSIASNILSAMKNPMVSDPMGLGFHVISGVTDVEVSQGTYNLGENGTLINWDIGDTLNHFVEGVPGVRYAQLNYTIEIDDNILKVPKPANGNYETNGQAQVSYIDINGQSQTIDFLHPVAKPIIVELKKELLDATGKSIPQEESNKRTYVFKVTVDDEPNYEKNYSILGNSSKVMTDIRIDSNHTIVEDSISGSVTTQFSDYDTEVEWATWDGSQSGVATAGTTLGNFPIPKDDGNEPLNTTITIRNKEKALGKLSITKVFNPNPVTKKSRSTPVFTIEIVGKNIYDLNEEIYRETREISAGDTIEIENLVYGEYTVKETESNGFIPNYVDSEGEATDGVVKIEVDSKEQSVQITNSPQAGDDVVNFVATKTWVNGSEAQHIKVDLRLYADGQLVEIEPSSVTPSTETSNIFTYTWTGLKKYNSTGGEIEYSIKEENTPQNYVVTYPSANAVVNTYDPNSNTKNITGNKVWINGPQTKPTTWFTLFRKISGGVEEKLTTLVLNPGTTSVVWENMPYTDDGANEYTYFVKETDLDGADFTPENYTKVEEELNVRNSYVSPKTEDLIFTKAWSGGPTVKPTISFQLMRKNGTAGIGETVGDAVEVINNSANFGKYDKTDINGIEYEYYVKEVGEENGVITLDGLRYLVEYEGNEVKNTFNQEYININAKKVWINGPTQKPEVGLKLYRKIDGGEEVDAVSGATTVRLLSGTTDAEWIGVEKTNAEGAEYIYSVKEVNRQEEDFTPENYTKVEEGLTVRNTYKIPKGTLTAEKVWIKGPEAKPEIYFTLYRGLGEVLEKIEGTTTLVGASNTVNWSDIELTDSDGKPYEFYAKETDADGVDFTPTNYLKQEELLKVTNYYVSPSDGTVEIKKVWEDIDGVTRPEVKITLHRKIENGVDEPVPSSSTFNPNLDKGVNNETHKWENLVTHNDAGKAYTFYVKEEFIEEDLLNGNWILPEDIETPLGEVSEITNKPLAENDRLGKITVEKILENELKTSEKMRSLPIKFSFKVTGPYSYEEEFELAAGETKELTKLFYGEYKIEETETQGYKPNYNKETLTLTKTSSTDKFVVTNSRQGGDEDPNSIDLTVEKVWVNGPKGTATIKLMRKYEDKLGETHEETVDTFTTTDTTLTKDYTDLPKHNVEGYVYEYYVTEPTPPTNYEVKIEGFKVTNTLKIDEIYDGELEVQKTWNDLENVPREPMKITLMRYTEKNPKMEIVPGAQVFIPSTDKSVNDEVFKWENQKSYDLEGNVYFFDAVEEFIEESVLNDNWFTTKVRENTVYLTNEPLKEPEDPDNPIENERTGKLTIDKEVVGNANTANLKSEIFKFKLTGPYDFEKIFDLKGGEKLELKGLFYGEYSIEEIETNGYTPNYDKKTVVLSKDNDQNSFTITNSKKEVDPIEPTPVTVVTAEKVWNDTAKYRPTIWFKLYRNIAGGKVEEVPKAEIKRLENGVTEVSWENIVREDINKNRYIFSVREVDRDGRDFVPEGYEKIERGLVVTNKQKYSPEIFIPITVPQLNKEDHFAYVIGYPDGGFKPESNVTRAEMSAIFARLLKEKIYLNENYSTFYSDVDANGWYAEYIGLLTELRIINGYPDGTFRPNNSVTRAEFATVASRFISNKKSVGGFRDVRNEYWARESIEFAKAEGWLNGYPDGTFKPEQNITRAEVVNIVNKMLDRNADKKYVDENVGGLYNYNDLSISHWAYYPIMEASNGHDYVRLPNKGEDWLNHRRP